MMSEQALSMEEPKKKLANLQEFLPDANNELVYDFGRHLAGYLNSELVPQGFVMGCELALYDLQEGINGFTGEPVQSKLVGYPPMIFRLLRMEIPNIAAAIFPADFADGVKNFVEQVNAKIREERTAS